MKIKGFIKRYIPLPAIIFVSLALICGVIHLIALLSTSFAEGFGTTVAAFFRFILAKATGWLPISFAELAIICLPIIITVIVIFAYKACKKGKEKAIRYICGLIAAITFFYSSFVLTFACSYRGYSLDSKLGLERADVSAEQLKYTTALIINELNALALKTEYGEDHFSNMPYSFSELNGKMNEAYEKGSSKYPFIQNMKSRVKPVILSEPMTYTHISGVYTYFTGEANVNVNYPEYNLPYTMAHEMAHQRGIAPENEANFVAYLICIESDDDFIKYSAYLNMFEYLSNALYKADKEAYKELIQTVDINVRYELVAYSDFFDKYRDNLVADVSNAVNNSYLISQGQVAGTRSYGLVVDLAVAYYKNANA